MQKNPIAAAIAPMRGEAINRAKNYMKNRIDVLIQRYMGLDLSTLRPKTTGSRADYKTQERLFSIIQRVVEVDSSAYTRGAKTPRLIIGRDEAEISKMIEEAGEMAAVQFDAYIGKLTVKIGDCDSAEIEGFLWDYSILTVKKGETVERWKTQMILNVSSLGLLFNQWPTRKIK